MTERATILPGDVFDVLPTIESESIHCCVTSPPYWALRDYGVDGQLGLEQTPEEYVERMVCVFREVRRVLRKDGTLWLNIGDSYAGGGNGGGGSFAQDGIRAALPGTDKNKATRYGRMRTPDAVKPKDLVGIPWLLAFALRADGWYLRSDIIWSKPNPMPESVTDRPTKAHEYLFLLSKSATYYYDAEAIREKAIYTGLKGQDESGFKSAALYNDKYGADLLHSKTNKRNGSDKQRGHSRRHAGFNDRWDLMDKEEQVANGRNKRTVWEIATHPYPEAHFATFPPDLVKPCILSGTSGYGVCAKCGDPWVRQTEKDMDYSAVTATTDKASTRSNGQGYYRPNSKETGGDAARSVIHTIGWQSSCDCKSEAVPATVLDPFTGSGTTGQVAIQYGRRFLGVELNPNYIELANKRLAPYLAQPLLLTT